MIEQPSLPVLVDRMVTIEGCLRQFLEFFKNSSFWAAILKSKLAQNLKFSQSRSGNFFGRVYKGFEA